MELMEIIKAIIVWTVFGLVCGAIARLLIPGRQAMSILMTIVLGIVGSFAGGFVAYLIFGGELLQASGFIFSVIGAVVVLAIYTWFIRRKTGSTM